MESVEVRSERLEEFMGRREGPVEGDEKRRRRFDSTTARAVGPVRRLTEIACRSLMPAGRLCLWVGHRQALELMRDVRSLAWDAPLHIPRAERREILIGRAAS